VESSPRVPALAVLAESLIGNRLGASVYRRWVDALQLTGDERVLDVGTGAGACARHIAERLTNGRLTCLDIDARWLAIARTRVCGQSAEFVVADLCEWSRPGAFDAATVHFVLHDVAPGRRALFAHRLAECLAPGGRVWLREPVSHGMTASEMDALLVGAGLARVGENAFERVPLMGTAVRACWVKP